MARTLRGGLGLLVLLLLLLVHCTAAVDVGDADASSLGSSTISKSERASRSLDGAQSRELVLDKLRSRPFVLVATANSTSSDGVIAAVLSSRFLITMVTWLTAANCGSTSTPSELFAVSTSQSIPVKRVWFERDFAPSESTNCSSPFAVIELERDDLPAVDLSTSLLAVKSVLDVVYLDPVLLRTSESLKSLPGAVLPSDACNQTSSASDSSSSDDGSVFCVQSDLPQQFAKMGFATVSGRVIGIVSGAATDSGQGTPQSFVHFGSAPHKQFLDQVTSNSLAWDIEGAPVVITTTMTPSPGPSFSTTPAPAPAPVSSPVPVGPTRVVFFGSDTTELNCGGVHIATDYVLTSASCVLGHNATRVSFQCGNFASSVSVANQIIHPSFELSGNDTTTFDFAVLFAPSPQNPTSSIVLDLDSVSAYITLKRLQLGESSQLQPVQALPPTSCTTLTSDLSSALQCVRAAPGSDGSGYLRVPVQSTNAALFRDSSSQVKYLVGFQPDTSASSSKTVDRFLLVADVSNFINANSIGHTWREVFDSDEDVVYPIAVAPPPTPSAGVAPPPANLVTVPPAPRTVAPAPLLPNSKRYVVGLRLTKTGKNFCGGVLISPLHVLTAANCVADGEMYWAAVGSSASAGDSDEILRVAQSSIVLHPKFGSPYMASNNVAILTLEHAAYSSPIAFEAAADFADGTPATMTGYGGGLSGSSQTVKSIALPVWSKRKCMAEIPNVDDSILCAGGEASEDACTGDAGSPLTIQSSSTGGDLLIGIVSAGYGCGQEGVPGFYTRTASLTEFIKGYTLGTKWSSSVPVKAPAIGVTVAPAVVNEDRSASIGSLELSELSPVSQNKVLSFLIGSEDRSNILDKELKTWLSGDSSSITLSSSEDLSAVTQIVEKHNALALNWRSDRFGTAAAAATGEWSSAAGAPCGI